MSSVLNIVLYQVAWFCCVLGAAHGHSLLGPAVVMLIVLVHLRLLSQRPGRELVFIVIATLAGTALDSVYAGIGILHFAGTAPGAALAPPWIAALWASFATIVNHSLAWLRERTVLCILLGALGGPLAYLAGAQLGAIEWQVSPELAVGVIALAWAVALPVMCAIARRLLENAPGGLCGAKETHA